MLEFWSKEWETSETNERWVRDEWEASERPQTTRQRRQHKDEFSLKTKEFGTDKKTKPPKWECFCFHFQLIMIIILRTILNK